MMGCDFVVKFCWIGLMVGLRQSIASTLPCDFYDSNNITSGIQHPNGSITYIGVEYRPKHYAKVNYVMEDDKRINVNGHYRGCPCLIRPCLRLCCPYGSYAMVNETTIESCIENEESTHFQIDVTNDNGESETIEEPEHFAYIENFKCKDAYYGDETIIYKNASILDENYGDKKFWANHRSSCLLILDDEGETYTEMMYCSDQILYLDESRWKELLPAYLVLISLVFIVFCLIVYICIPELLNLNIICFMCYLVCFGVAYSTLAWIVINGSKPVNFILCKAVGFMAYFSLLSIATWLNVLSFDLWMNFRQTIRIRWLSETKQLLLFAAYAWGLPLFAVIVVLIMDSIESIDPKYKPGMGLNSCFLKENKEDHVSKLLYYRSVFSIIYAMNIVFFILTAFKIFRVKREVKGCASRKGKNNENFFLFMRLSLMMGVFLVVETIPWELHEPGSVISYLLFVANILNRLQPVFIFCLFILRARVRGLIRERWNTLIGGSLSNLDSVPKASSDLSIANKIRMTEIST